MILFLLNICVILSELKQIIMKIKISHGKFEKFANLQIFCKHDFFDFAHLSDLKTLAPRIPKRYDMSQGQFVRPKSG